MNDGKCVAKTYSCYTADTCSPKLCGIITENEKKYCEAHLEIKEIYGNVTDGTNFDLLTYNNVEADYENLLGSNKTFYTGILDILIRIRTELSNRKSKVKTDIALLQTKLEILLNEQKQKTNTQTTKITELTQKRKQEKSFYTRAGPVEKLGNDISNLQTNNNLKNIEIEELKRTIQKHFEQKKTCEKSIQMIDLKISNITADVTQMDANINIENV